MQVTAAMNSGINEIVNNLAEPAEEEETQRGSLSAPQTEGKTRRPSNTKSMFGLSTPGKPEQLAEKADKAEKSAKKERGTDGKVQATPVSKPPAPGDVAPAAHTPASALVSTTDNAGLSSNAAVDPIVVPVPESAAVAAAPKRRAQEQPTEPSLLALPQPASLSAPLTAPLSAPVSSAPSRVDSTASTIWDNDTTVGSAGGGVGAPLSVNRSQSSLSDPLSLLLAPSNDSPSTPSPMPPHSLFDKPSSTSPVLTGRGTGYKNMPADAIQPPNSESRDPFHLHDPVNAADLSVLTSPSLMRSTFFTKEWFPGTSSVRKEKSKRHKLDKTPGNDASASYGMNLHELHTRPSASQKGENDDQSGSSDESGDSELENTSLHKSSKTRKNRQLSSLDREALSERVLDLVGSLLHPSYTELSPAVTQGHELEYEQAVRQNAVKKLLALRDILTGASTLQEFDVRFPPIEASPMPVKNKASSTESSQDNDRERKKKNGVGKVGKSPEASVEVRTEERTALNLKDEMQVEPVSSAEVKKSSAQVQEQDESVLDTHATAESMVEVVKS